MHFSDMHFSGNAGQSSGSDSEIALRV